MSRTFRRKRAKWDRWEWIEPSKYHSDSCTTMNMVPKWYKVEFIRRPFRRKQKRAIENFLKTGKDPVMPIDKKAAKYYW